MHRFFEIFPGALAWLTLVLMALLSWQLPAAVAVFIILFDIYWLFKTVYLSLHMRSTFKVMRANLKVNWLEKLKERDANVSNYIRMPQVDSHRLSWQTIYHLIIFPMYREQYEVARESLAKLSAANYPKDKFIVVLAIEERAGEEAKRVAREIEREFASKFFKFLITTHPADLPGEIPGKGSNESWAAREARRLIIDPLIASTKSENPEPHSNKPNDSEHSDRFGYSDYVRYDNILVSVFDIDTQVFPEYFSRLTYVFLNAPDRLRAIYQPIPLFVNNIYQAPALARVVAFSSTFWQMIQQSRPERLTTFSSQSLPFPALLDIGFWQKDVVSEDSRIFWQGYLRYHGEFRAIPLLYPVSMDANVAPTFWRTMKNVYRQQRRWGWGCENIPFMLDGFRKDPKVPLRKKWYWSFNVIEGFHSWATNSLMIFALGWLPLILGGENFGYTLLSYGLPQITRYIMSLAMIGIVSSAVLSLLLLPERPNRFRAWHILIYCLQWLLMPITLIIFGAIPGLEAQTRLALGGKFRLGFWVTPKGRYPKAKEGSGGK